MCFSASASLVASSALAAGGYAISRIPKKKSAIPLSLLPLIFAIHQLIEGILWLNHMGLCSDHLRSIAIYGYSFIAYMLWPIYVPFSIYQLESEKTRRRIILICQIIGLYISLATLRNILQYPVDVSIIDQSFSYSLRTPEFMMAPYFISVTIPFLVCSDKKLVIFGGALTISCVAAALLVTSATFPSVWCFFAAVLSGGLYLYFKTSPEIVRESEQQSIGEMARTNLYPDMSAPLASIRIKIISRYSKKHSTRLR